MEPLPGMPHEVAARFVSGGRSPEELYVHDVRELDYHRRWSGAQDRMISRSAPLDEILIYTDGSCLDQHISGDATERRAGCAVIYKPKPRSAAAQRSTARGFSLRLESRGPTGKTHPQTSNRAELRAAIAALECRDWINEGSIRVTIATDSSYVGNGITDWIGTWMRNDWRTSDGKRVANRDLW